MTLQGQETTGPVPVNSVAAGMAYMLMSVLLAPGIDIFSKLSGQHVPATEVAFSRFIVQILLMLPFVMARGSLQKQTVQVASLHALRGFLMAVGMTSFAIALQTMNVADAIAIFFVEPAILTVLGGIFLKETIGWRRYLACLLGFAGALLIIRPNFQAVGWVAFLPILTAFCVAVFLLISKHQARREDPWSMQLQAGLWGALFTLVTMCLVALAGFEQFAPKTPSGIVWFYLLGTGVMATVSSLLGIYALRHAPAATLAPLQYLEIVSATLFTWIIFGDVLDAWKWLGVCIIIASGLFIIWREQRLKSVSRNSDVITAP